MDECDRVERRIQGLARSPRVSAEAVNDRAKLMMHRLVARRLAVEPALIDRARDALRSGSRDRPKLACMLEWERLLGLDPGVLRRRLTERSEEMERLRLSSPFAAVAGFQEPDIRRRIWSKARRGLMPGA
ncbi:hypothetical protein [Arenibaculum sp.]|jgi:hypothetical protein|uniref:hypothetical protein n=1 Tax=Arenibaculum sp. TaxID=2865862 RepID=UPI002E102770|nr:hypothetical protein [Arenibaculum sp.]